jgi:hypothetical protein
MLASATVALILVVDEVGLQDDNMSLDIPPKIL